MTVAVSSRRESAAGPSPLTAAAAALPARSVLDRLGTGVEGLPEDETERRLRMVGPNAVRTHRARAWPVLARQLRSPLLLLLAVTALASAFVGPAPRGHRRLSHRTTAGGGMSRRSPAGRQPGTLGDPIGGWHGPAGWLGSCRAVAAGRPSGKMADHCPQ